MATRPRLVQQMAFDEQIIEDADLETALELPEGGAARVGRFRITRTAVAGRSVTFDTKATSRVRIVLVGEDE